MKQKIIALLCALTLCLGLTLVATAEEDVMFISLNDSLPIPLSTDTMPFRSDGLLYVPSTTFDFRVTDIYQGFYSVYSAYNQNITMYNKEKMLRFDLTNDTCVNYHTGEVIPVHAIVKNGIPFVPVNTVCNFFRLNYKQYTTEYGQLLRITDNEVVLSDAVFIDAASTLMSSRLKEYKQSLTPPPVTPEPEVTPPPVVTPPVTPPVTTPDPVTPPVEIKQVTVYLGVRCGNGDGIQDILSALTSTGRQAVFFLTPQQMESDGNLLRQILGGGHTIGILAEGATVEETHALLEEGNRQLAQAAYTTTAVVLCPPDQQEALEDHWIFWNETDSLIPTEGNSADRYGAAIIRSLSRDIGTTYLTLDDSQDMGDALSGLIAQLTERNFIVDIPVETRLK